MGRLSIRLVMYASLIGFHPHWLKVSTGDDLPRKRPRPIFIS